MDGVVGVECRAPKAGAFVFRSGNLSIRAAKFGPETDAFFVLRLNKEFHETDEIRGSFEGAIRISFHSLSFLFNDLAFLDIPRKSLKFLTLLFSLPTASACL
jgi:hypothetical protein